MSELKTITSMARAGQIQEAYDLAMADLKTEPDNVWAQRGVGWVLYYMIKNEAVSGDYDKLYEHLEELKSLSLLTSKDDGMLFDNVVFQLASFVKNHLRQTDSKVHEKLSDVFAMIKDLQFNQSFGYSFLLQSCLAFKKWNKLAVFIEWWNLDNLRAEDYVPYQTIDGKRVITLAERAYIAYAKALLSLNTPERIESFLPKLEILMDTHPEFVYPGYFYGKLLLNLGSERGEALRVIVPFARKKAADFWVWHLLSEMYPKEDDRHLACLLRAVHCKTQEAFLKNVRLGLVSAYIQRKQFDRAKFHLDAVVRCCANQGWGLPDEVDYWIHEPWIDQVVSNGTDSLNYREITSVILCEGTEEAVAVVTYVDEKSRRASLIYGFQQKMAQKLQVKVRPGDVLRLNYEKDAEDRVVVVDAVKIPFPSELPYARKVEGTVSMSDGKEFAFLKSSAGTCFISPAIVRYAHLSNAERVEALVAYDYDKKKDKWNWSCVSVKKIEKYE